MYYEINISRNGRHFFATAERSIIDPRKLVEVIKVFRAKFPKAEGYEISVTRWSNEGLTIPVGDIA